MPDNSGINPEGLGEISCGYKPIPIKYLVNIPVTDGPH